MRGWIFFPENQESSNIPRKIQFFHGMDSFMVSEEEPGEPESLPSGKIQGASLGFYCGPLAGDMSPYPSLLEGVSKYPSSPYKPRFQLTRKIWDSLPGISVHPSGEPPSHVWTGKTFNASYIVVNGSFPNVMENLFVYGCRSFLFSPYVLK